VQMVRRSYPRQGRCRDQVSRAGGQISRAGGQGSRGGACHRRPPGQQSIPAREVKPEHARTNIGKLARQACEEEIILLRNRSEVILGSLDSLEEEKLARKQHHYKAKNSVLRSFQWKEKEIDPVILEGAVAFWAVTGGKDCTGTSNRT
jgi:hypothetical protein